MHPFLSGAVGMMVNFHICWCLCEFIEQEVNLFSIATIGLSRATIARQRFIFYLMNIKTTRKSFTSIFKINNLVRIEITRQIHFFSNRVSILVIQVFKSNCIGAGSP